MKDNDLAPDLGCTRREFLPEGLCRERGGVNDRRNHNGPTANCRALRQSYVFPICGRVWFAGFRVSGSQKSHGKDRGFRFRSHSVWVEAFTWEL